MQHDLTMDQLFGPSSSPILGSSKPQHIGRAFSSSYVNAGTSATRSAANDATANGVEVLFAHDSARVVAFSPPIGASLPTPPRTRGDQSQEEQGAGTLPWSSPTETTISAGE